MVTSVRNGCTDFIRKQSSQNKYIENLAAIYSSITPDEIYTIKELEKILQAALQELPKNIQSAFSMSRTQKLTYNEIAAEMNISPKTVESYISQTLKVLREELKDYLPINISILT